MVNRKLIGNSYAHLLKKEPDLTPFEKDQVKKEKRFLKLEICGRFETKRGERIRRYLKKELKHIPITNVPRPRGNSFEISSNEGLLFSRLEKNKFPSAEKLQRIIHFFKQFH